jgi:hypothetical protein
MNLFKNGILGAIVAGFLLSGSLNLNAQETDDAKVRPVQLTFVYPLGTNWTESGEITSNFSYNMLIGYNGGLKGVEFSGFGSVLKGDMSGAQFAGFGNNVLGITIGAQFAGYYNFSNDSVSGAQFAGFANVVAGDIHGAQIAGFANVATEIMDGIQIGVFNYVKKLSGVQLGVFNYADSVISGTPIGFLSFVRNGYKTVEIGTSETLHGYLSFKTGTRKFYNILSVGGSLRENGDEVLWGWGYGVGTLLRLNNRFDVAIEGMSYHLNENEWFTNRINMLNKLNISFSYKLAEHFTLFGGGSWNVVVSETEDEFGNPVESAIAPYHTYNYTCDNGINVKMYPGFNAGIRF